MNNLAKMNHLESIREEVKEYLEKASQKSEFWKMIMLKGTEDVFPHLVYDAFFNLITDHTQTPEAIIHLLDTYTRGLDHFSTNRPMQTLIAYACLGALVKRKPKKLIGPWETLVWIIVKYSAYASTIYGSVLTSFEKSNIVLETVQWITDICSQESCPNPCLRLELFRFLRCFNCKYHYEFQKLFRDKVIITLSEICNNYTSLSVVQLPHFSPIDLHFIMKVNKMNIRFVMNDYDLHLKKSEIIVAVLKLCSLLALLEKEKQLTGISQAIGFDIRDSVVKKQFSSCLIFCGLIPHITGRFIDIYKSMLHFVQALGNDSLLLNHMIDTLDTITKVSFYFPEVECLQDEVFKIKGTFLQIFFKSHIEKSPKNQYLQEIYGGNTQAKEYHLRYFQNNIVGLCLDFEFVDLEEDISDEEDIPDEEDISDEVDKSDEQNISD